MSTEIVRTDIGPISAASARPQLAYIPKAPGLYRILSEDGWCYIGQAKDLHHRIYEYHHPTLDNEHEHRIHRLIRRHRCKLQVILGESLSDGSKRKSLEKSAIIASKALGLKMWNLSQNTTADRIKMRIDYHRMMMDELTELLSKEIGG